MDDDTHLEIWSPIFKSGIEKQSFPYMHRVQKITKVMARYLIPNEINEITALYLSLCQISQLHSEFFFSKFHELHVILLDSSFVNC